MLTGQETPGRIANPDVSGLYGLIAGRLHRAGFGVADQAFNGARQFCTLLIASFLMSRDAFADFAIVNAAALLLTMLPNYVIRLPMLVLAGSRFSTDEENYLSSIRWLDAGLSVTGGIVAGFFLSFRFQGIRAPAVVFFVLMCLASNTLEINRRACYIVQHTDMACRGSAAALLVACGGMALIHLWLPLDLNRALIVQVLAALAGIAVCWRGPFFPRRAGIVSFRNIALAHRPYAGWELLGGTLLWCSTNGMIIWGAKLLSTGQIGAFRLLTSLCTLITLPIAVTEMLLTTRASERFFRQGKTGLALWLRDLNARFGRLLLPYIVMTTAGCWVFVRLVFSAKYPDAKFMFPIFAVHTGLTVLPATRNIALRAMLLQRLVCASEIGRSITCFAVCAAAFVLHSPVVLTCAVAFGTLAFVLGQWRSTYRELLAEAPAPSVSRY